MSSEIPVTSVDSWLELVELPIPVLKNKYEKGKVYKVLKVGFALFPEYDCRKKGIKATIIQVSKSILPTVFVNLEENQLFYRLPVGLGMWAFDSVALAVQGTKLFPSDVEFGIIDGRAFAEIM